MGRIGEEVAKVLLDLSGVIKWGDRGGDLGPKPRRYSRWSRCRFPKKVQPKLGHTIAWFGVCGYLRVCVSMGNTYGESTPRIGG